MDLKRTAIRVGVFAALVGVELYLARSMVHAPSIKGYIETKSYGVSGKGVIRKIDVGLGQHVGQGHVVVELDTASIDTEIAIAMAERKRAIAAARAGSDASGEDSLEVVDRRIEQLVEKRDALMLKSPADGMIESIDARAGDSIGPESPVATIVSTDTRHVIACIPEARIGEVEVGSTAEISSVVGTLQLHGRVESMTPAITTLPPRCQPVVTKPPTFGRIAVVVLDRPADGLPGQSQMIAFGPPSTTSVPTPVVSAEGGAAPALVTVPPEIIAVSAFEASGLVWVASLDRYVVVSDETGLNKAGHPPWLFTMSQRGILDPEPLVVANVDALDDVESIAAGDDGGLWIAASQSVSEKGNRPGVRGLLAHLVPDGAGYRADKKTRLFELLDAAPEATRRNLGVKDTKLLDIEGMAYRGGALYLGLKAPTDDSDQAMIWRIARPEKLLAGDLEGAGAAIWGTVAIQVEVDGRPFRGGIADMTFLSDNLLVVCATASGINAKHQSGAVYAVAVNGGKLRATRLQTFRELKPEGVAVAPEAGKLTIVFDRGHEPVMWTQIDTPPDGL